MNCDSCKHRRNLTWSAHSACGHPKANALFVMLPQNNPLGIKQNPHGVRNGWCLWPIEFDPLWIDACNGFEEK